MRKLITILFLITFTFINIPSAYADIILEGISNLHATEVNFIDSSPHTRTSQAEIELEWNIETSHKDAFDFGKHIVEIYRIETRYDKAFSRNILLDKNKIAEIDCNKAKYDPEGPFYTTETHTLTYKDTVKPGKKYKYAVRYGSLTWQRDFIDEPVNVLTQEQYDELQEKDDEMSERREKYEKSASWPERLAGNIILAIPNYLINVIGMEDPVELIYNVDLNEATGKKENIVIIDNGKVEMVTGSDSPLHTFTREEFGALTKYYNRINDFVPISLVVIVVLLGIGVLYTSINPNSRITLKEYIIGLILGVVLLKFGVYIITAVFDINDTIVNFFEWTVGEHLSSSFLDSLISTDGLSLGSAIITCLAVFSIGILNWQYAVRKIVIGILLGLLPVIAVLSVIPSRRPALGSWIKEFFSQVFLQASHAAVLSLGLLFMANGAGFWVKLSCIMGLPVMAGVVRRVFDAESFSNNIAGSVGASALGVASLFSVGKMLKSRNNNVESLSNIDSTAQTAMANGGQNTAPTSQTGGGIFTQGLKVAAGTTAGFVGGIVSSTLTGKPSFGFSGAITGASSGASLVERGREVVHGGFNLLSKNTEKMGMSDPSQLDDPGQAFQFGKNTMGGGFAGSIAGAGMAATSSFKYLTNKGEGSVAAQAKDSISKNQLSLQEANQDLKNFKPVYEKAKADFTYAKNVYGDNSTRMQGLNNKAHYLEEQKKKLDSDYQKADNSWENNYKKEWQTGRYWTSEMEQAHNKVEILKNQRETVGSELEATKQEISTGKQLFSESKERFEKAEAELGMKQFKVSELEHALSPEGIKSHYQTARQNLLQKKDSWESLKEDINNTKQQKQEAKGGLETSWR